MSGEGWLDPCWHVLKHCPHEFVFRRPVPSYVLNLYNWKCFLCCHMFPGGLFECLCGLHSS